MDKQLLHLAEQWVDEAMAAPKKPRPKLLGADAGKPVVSGAVLIGPERGKALKASAAIREAISSEDYAEGLKIFKTDAMNGATSILEIARLAADYNPLDQKDPNRAAKYADYIRRVMKAPFFSLAFSNAQRIENKSKDWDALITAVTDTFEGIAAEDKSQVAKSLGTLAKAAASSKQSRQTEDLFVQNVLQASPGRYEIFIYTSHVELSVDEKKGSTTKQSLFEVARAKLMFRAVEWPFLAERVWAKKFKATDEWLDENTTPDGNLRTNLCLSVLKPTAAHA